MSEKQTKESIINILDKQDDDKSLLIIKQGSLKKIDLPAFGKVTLKVHQDRITHVSVEKTTKIE